MGEKKLSTEKEKRLIELRKKYKVSWEWGTQSALEVFDQVIATYLNNQFGSTVVRQKV